ncbi:MAG: hypothetical protein Q4F72_05495 [Desulfovibrionaceae bacterium]|nr:hypothetical protein [Desulfovibrionaceae bacterium]
MITCPRCGSQAIYRNGRRAGRQCYLCRECGFQFTNLAYRERPLWEKLLAVTVHAMGISPSAIARLFCTSTSSLARWQTQTWAPGDEKQRRDMPAVLGLSRIAPLLEAAGIEEDGERRVLVIVDEKNANRVVGVIVRE